MEITNQLKQKVWEKGQIVDGFNPDMYRKDPCGAWIAWDKYGIRDNWQAVDWHLQRSLCRRNVNCEEPTLSYSVICGCA